MVYLKAKITPGQLGRVCQVSLKTKLHSSNMLVHGLRDKLKTYDIMGPEETSENVYERDNRAKKPGSLKVGVSRIQFYS